MRKFALIGHPIGHTMSPPIHERLFALSNAPAEYEVFDIHPEKLKEEIPKLFKYQGLNVTIPHKISVMEYLSSLDESAERYGAVNVIDCKNLRGYNTDVIGFKRAVLGLGASLTESVLLIGCGGAGRMMAIEIAFSGGEVTIAVRESDKEQALSLCKEINEKTGKQSKVILLDELNSGAEKPEFKLLVNATPVGMFPNVNACPVSEDVIKSANTVFDAIYNPRKTSLVKTAEKYNIPAGGGMAMLVWQAAAAHEIWDKAEYKNEDISKIISDMEDLMEKQGS